MTHPLKSLNESRGLSVIPELLVLVIRSLEAISHGVVVSKFRDQT